MNVKIKKLRDNVILPKKAHDTDACFDIYYTCDKDNIYNGVYVYAGQTAIIDTGFATEIPHGYYATVYGRSGLGIKQGLRPSNCVGIIDADYRNEWKVALYNDSNEDQFIENGDRIAQFMICPVLDTTLEEVDEVNETVRGLGGLGSTGK